MSKNEKEIAIIREFKFTDTPKRSIRQYWLRLIDDGLGNPVHIPIIVARGTSDHPVLGITAAVHGNELNGIPVIHRLFREIEAGELKGTIIAVPVVNVPSFVRKQRRFNDSVDLNHIMPGIPDGNVSQIYAHRFIERVVHQFEFLLDLHTASLGRVNSHYIRANMDKEVTSELARLQNAEIIVHNPPSDGTLRGAAEDLGIPAITIELGNPNTFQKRFTRSGVEGIHNVLSQLGMTADPIRKPKAPTIYCRSSYWIYTDIGGLLTVHPELTDKIRKGKKIATIRDVFGEIRKTYTAPESGIVIGKSVSPVNQTGGRILHLGVEIQ